MSERAHADSSIPRLGAQLWLEEHDDSDRINHLVGRAAAVGMNELRVFLMWPWMQDSPESELEFARYDAVFAAAAQHGIGIKATLTANSGPWWLGTPGVLHSFTMTLASSSRPAMRRYVQECVKRYAEHPALTQWILWNEPINPVDGKDGPPVRTDEAREVWHSILQERYGSIHELNRVWRTGYRTFREVPFADEITHPAHSRNAWRGFAPRLDDVDLRATIVRNEIHWLAELVRSRDSRTPLCVNPNGLFHNHADAGYQLTRLAGEVDVIGASFHAPWSFTYAPRPAHTALIAVGVSLLRSIPGDHGIEVTEMQLGNTYYAGEQPIGVGRPEISASYLAAALAGAESITGWSLNTRHQDFEAGEWGLLDDLDEIGERALGVADARTALDTLHARLGSWHAAPPDVLVIVDETSQAIEMLMALVTDPETGRGTDVSIHGATLLAVELMRLGYAAAVAPSSALDENVSAHTVIVSHQIAWTEEFAQRLDQLARAGVTVLIDGTSGQLDQRATLHRPWPGGLASVFGARSAGLDSPHDGSGQFALEYQRASVGQVASVRTDFVVDDDAWVSDDRLTFAVDATPALWQRHWGDGRFLYSRFSLAAAALRSEQNPIALRTVLAEATTGIERSVIPQTRDAFVLHVLGERDEAWGVFSAPVTRDGSASISLTLPQGEYDEVISGETIVVTQNRHATLRTLRGIALLVPRRADRPV